MAISILLPDGFIIFIIIYVRKGILIIIGYDLMLTYFAENHLNHASVIKKNQDLCVCH